MAEQELAMQVLQQVVKLPVVKVDREKFLVEKFSKELGHKNLNSLCRDNSNIQLYLYNLIFYL